MPSQETDLRYLRLALSLARRGLGGVWPNPAVGCVLVKDSRIIGRGRTATGGRPHAETLALQQAGEDAGGATAYLSLEPCSHHGKTPPCAEALIQAGITRAVIACQDPDPRVSGNGIALLQKAGIHVTTGVLQQEAETLNAGFFSRIRRQRPLVALKLATSSDGMIADPNTDSPWITGEPARTHGHFLRSRYDAILVGIGTVLADNPRLTCRLPGLESRSPVRIVMDTQLKMPLDCALLEDIVSTPLYIITGPVSDSALRQRLEQKGVRLLTCDTGADGLNPEKVLQLLAHEGITRLLIEGGSTIATSFITAGLVDRLYWYQAPHAIGPQGLAALQGLSLDNLVRTARLSAKETSAFLPDQLSVYEFNF